MRPQLPTTAVYLTLAIIVAPALVQMGVPKMAAHMCIFYMGVTSDLTPPTCLSPFAAAAIAGSPPMATAWQAMRLGAVLFIVPFMFVYSSALLMIGSRTAIVPPTARAAVGVLCLAAGLQGGYDGGRPHLNERCSSAPPGCWWPPTPWPTRSGWCCSGSSGCGRPCAAPPGRPLRPLLRWTSLLASAGVLAVLGSANTHQQNFPLFLVAVLALAALTVAVFLRTGPRGKVDGADSS